MPTLFKSTTKQLAPVYVHALHKSASMFLYQFFKRICQRQKIPFYSENDDPPTTAPTPSPESDAAFCCCPLRTFDVADDSSQQNQSPWRIFHVRDPRDMIVSEYFSFGWTHETEKSKLSRRQQEIQKMSVDEYVIGQSEFSSWPLEEKFAPLLNRTLHPQRDIVVKYETMVLDFPAWAAAATKPFAFRFPAFQLAKLNWRYRNEFQAEPNSHKRRVIPGDFRNQLAETTIAILNERYAEILQRFQYEP